MGKGWQKGEGMGCGLMMGRKKEIRGYLTMDLMLFVRGWISREWQGRLSIGDIWRSIESNAEHNGLGFLTGHLKGSSSPRLEYLI
jgi:hypothetical protein